MRLLYKLMVSILLLASPIMQVDAMTVRAEAYPEIGPGTVEVGSPFSVDIYLNNEDYMRVAGHSMSFVFYSPDAGISTVEHYDVGGVGSFYSIELLNGFEIDTTSYFGYFNHIFEFSWDEYLPDTVNHTGLGGCGSWPNDLGEQLNIRFHFVIDDEGTFCIDSVDHPNHTFDWLFEDPSPPFGGPYCWVVSEYCHFSAQFWAVPRRGKAPLPVMFNTFYGCTGDEYYWEFGDGGYSTMKNPIHYYTSEGSYDVKLKVSRQLNDTVLVDSVVRTDYIVVTDLDANFSANPTAGEAPLSVQFTDMSTGSPDQWFWDFGDGSYSYLQNPGHQYSDTGHFDVYLEVSGNGYIDNTIRLDYIHVAPLYCDLFGEIYGSEARSGFDFWFNCVWANIGTYAAENCTLKVLPPPEMIFYDVIPKEINTGTYSGYTTSGDTIIIPLQTIDPSGWYGGYIKVFGHLPTGIPNGTILTCMLWLSSTTPEANPGSNDAVRLVEVVGSIDPNDKLAYPEGSGDAHSIDAGQRLSYTIQFENKPEATADAIYVMIVDTLDPDLNWGTLAFGDMSHPECASYNFDAATGEIVWFFDSIMLPPNVIPPEGEGYVTFSVSTHPGAPDGMQLTNTAWIRFDYNEWLEAPEEGPVLRTIGLPVGCGDANSDGTVNILDITFLISYLYKDGPAPLSLWAADVDSSGAINILDITYLIAFLYKDGPDPNCQ